MKKPSDHSSSPLRKIIVPEEVIRNIEPIVFSDRFIPANDAMRMINLFIVKKMEDAHHISKVVVVS